MTIEEYVEKEKGLLEDFQRYWKAEQLKRGPTLPGMEGANFPDDLEIVEEWREQFDFYVNGDIHAEDAPF